jgi:hypothetical protein
MQVGAAVPVGEDVQVGEAVPEGETVPVGVEAVGEGVGVGVGEGSGGEVVGGVLVVSLWIDTGEDCPTTATARRGPCFWGCSADVNLNTADLCGY